MVVPMPLAELMPVLRVFCFGVFCFDHRTHASVFCAHAGEPRRPGTRGGRSCGCGGDGAQSSRGFRRLGEKSAGASARA